MAITFTIIQLILTLVFGYYLIAASRYNFGYLYRIQFSISLIMLILTSTLGYFDQVHIMAIFFINLVELVCLLLMQLITATEKWYKPFFIISYMMSSKDYNSFKDTKIMAVMLSNTRPDDDYYKTMEIVLSVRKSIINERIYNLYRTCNGFYCNGSRFRVDELLENANPDYNILINAYKKANSIVI